MGLTTIDQGFVFITLNEPVMDSNFEVFCKFDSFVNSGKFIDKSTILCRAPEVSSSRMSKVSISFDGILFSNSLSFTYIEPVQVSSITPQFGATDGGTTVVISGSSFHEYLTYHCVFGTSKVMAEFISTSSLRCISPAGIVGDSLFSIVTGNVNILQHSHHFTYISEPVVVDITPSVVSIQGGDRVAVLVIGVNLLSMPSRNVWCMFGDRVVNGQVSSSSQLVCSTPPSYERNSNTVSVKISLNGMDFYGDDHAILYQESPTIYDIVPFHGVATGTNIDIIGVSFPVSDDIRCAFGGSQNSVATRVSSTLIRCISPIIDDASFTGKQMSLGLIFDGVVVYSPKVFYVDEPVKIDSIYPSAIMP
jgi:hypothetical protein